jgi:K+-transporting ATPase KdpF subunit
MAPDLVLGALLSVALAAWLFYSLVRAERF